MRQTGVTRMAWAMQPNRGRSTIALTALATALAVGGCGGDRKQGAMTSDLERDLQMAITAQRPRLQVVSAIEGGAPPNAPSGNQRGRRDAIPTRRTAPRPQPHAEVQETAAIPQLDPSTAPTVEVTQQGEPAPTEVPAAVMAPSAQPTISEMPSRGPSDGSGTTQGTSRRGGGWGTAIGVIIRGASAGVDNCEEHDRRAGGRRNGGGIITTGGFGGVIGGAIGGVIANGGGTRRGFPRF